MTELKNKIRVIVVDDSSLIRQLFSQMLASDPDIEVLGSAVDAFDAREKIKRLNPDVITLDIDMPKMDGIAFLEKIMALRPMPVVMASTFTQRGADISIRALEMGAADYIAKPAQGGTENLLQLRDELIAKVKAAAEVTAMSHHAATGQPSAFSFSGDPHGYLIAIGASTGGVEAIRDVLMPMPTNAPPIVIAQHMPETFTHAFAERLNHLCRIKVCEARHNQPIMPGYAYIAPGGMHMEIRRTDKTFHCYVHAGPAVCGHRPSVDVLFHSVATYAQEGSIGVILTGMGKDGAGGLLAMRRSGARTLGQSAASCTVYGMPRTAMEAGAVEKELPLTDMAREILRLCGGKAAAFAAHGQNELLHP